jgi:hypothetical protein
MVVGKIVQRLDAGQDETHFLTLFAAHPGPADLALPVPMMDGNTLGAIVQHVVFGILILTPSFL